MLCRLPNLKFRGHKRNSGDTMPNSDQSPRYFVANFPASPQMLFRMGPRRGSRLERNPRPELRPPLRSQRALQGRAGKVAALLGHGPDGELPEIVERPDHPWFIGVQFHPEMKSKAFDPHPLFASFIEAAVKQSRLV
jgi:hypothetical protein